MNDSDEKRAEYQMTYAEVVHMLACKTADWAQRQVVAERKHGQNS